MNLEWQEKSSKEVYRCPVFGILERESVGPDGQHGRYFILDGPSWAIVMPKLSGPKPGHSSGVELDEEFYLVRQWRHGAQSLSLEFPGGVVEKGETPEQGARRELAEETGCTAQKFTLLGSMNPNPAIQNNSVYIFLAEGCTRSQAQHTDSDEFLNVETMRFGDIAAGMGRPPFIHALMGTALGLYLTQSMKA
jgi:mutator protein MutT